MDRHADADVVGAREPRSQHQGRPVPGIPEKTIFDGLPYAALVVRGRSVVAVNAALRDRLGVVRAGARTCCALLGCARSRGDCVSQAAASEAPMRLARLGDSWVSSTSIGDGLELVVVRSADAEGTSEAPPGERFRFRTLGPAGVAQADAGIGGNWLVQRPGQLLMLLVAGRRRWLHADEIIEQLWPRAGAHALNSLRFQVHALRRHLEPDRARGGQSVVLCTAGGYRLNPELIDVDADRFDELVTAGLSAESLRGARSLLEEAVALYRGDFLADLPYADWALDERERLRATLARALRVLIDAHEDAGDLDAAAGHAERLVDLDPYDSSAARELLRLCLRRGRRSEALRRYGVLSSRLRREFGEVPDFTLAEVRAEAAAGLPGRAWR